MKKEYKVKGMSCNHCRMHVEKALGSIPGVKASVSLEPAVAVVESDEEIPLQILQAVVSEKAGDYTLEQ